MDKQGLTETLEYVVRYIDKHQSETRGRGAGKNREWERETNKYQKELAALYAAFTLRLARRIDDADPDEFDAIVAAEVEAYREDMKELGRKRLLAGFIIGLGAFSTTSRGLNRMSFRVAENERFIDTSLIPAIMARINQILADDDVLETGLTAIRGSLVGLTARVEKFAGGMWTAIQEGVGEVSLLQADRRIIWMRDPLAKHCPSCIEFGLDPPGREFESFELMLAITGGIMPGAGTECNGNDRCQLLFMNEGVFARP